MKAHSLRNSHIVLFTVTVVDLVDFWKRVAAQATFAVSKSSLGASLCTFFRFLAFCFLDLNPGVGGVIAFLLRPVRYVGGVRLLLVDGFLPAVVGGGVDAVLAVLTNLGVARPMAAFPPLPSLFIACEGAQHEHDERCFRLLR